MTVPLGLSRVSSTDAELVERVRGGDLDAYAELVARYRPRLGRYAQWLLGNREDAEEALQDAFVRAYRAIDSCADPARFGAWLLRILVNRCRTRLSRRDMVRRDADAELAYDRAAAPANGDPGWREEIQRALARLGPEQREAFVLKYVEERSYEEMVTLTGVGESALKMRVKRACERLRELLGEVYHG